MIIITDNDLPLGAALNSIFKREDWGRLPDPDLWKYIYYIFKREKKKSAKKMDDLLDELAKEIYDDNYDMKKESDLQVRVEHFAIF